MVIKASVKRHLSVAKVRKASASGVRRRRGDAWGGDGGGVQLPSLSARGRVPS
jgi:hypothetical protein